MNYNQDPFPFADLELARRLEVTEGHANVDFVEARAAAFPNSGAQWTQIGGTYAMYDGAASPVTQTFCLGITQPVTKEDMKALEHFFQSRGADVFHEVSPLAHPTSLALLNERRYQPLEFTSVLYRTISRDVRLASPGNKNIEVRLIGSDDYEMWTDISVRGWSEYAELSDFLFGLGKVGEKRKHALSFMAELNGKPIATGVLVILNGVALLAGASTIPEGRRQGAQLALLEYRLRYAAEHDCDIAMMGALPGSASQRNAERHGFRIAYTRTKWRLAQSPTT